MSRASIQIPLTGLFLAATHGPKTCLTSQGEHALIRLWLWTLASDVDLTGMVADNGEEGMVVSVQQEVRQSYWEGLVARLLGEKQGR
jgi:hypothetical protein